ncbi:MAG: thioredoxin [Saprospiraceae bacterium]|jgi:thioredoxin 1|nr:thioredoxin [Saprospiraceae bacterium]MDP4820186.1 thioredoxin [Saprospiraceae bacterium]MDP4998685.1 thioredoxin [Saprospiraceae bacterium]
MSKTNFGELINSSTPVIMDFYADWCAPCRIQSPILEKLKAEMGDAVKIVKIDVDRNPAIAQQLQIMGIPTLMIFQNGKAVWRASGVQQIPVLKKQIEALTQA